MQPLGAGFGFPNSRPPISISDCVRGWSPTLKYRGTSYVICKRKSFYVFLYEAIVPSIVMVRAVTISCGWWKRHTEKERERECIFLRTDLFFRNGLSRVSNCKPGLRDSVGWKELFFTIALLNDLGTLNCKSSIGWRGSLKKWIRFNSALLKYSLVLELTRSCSASCEGSRFQEMVKNGKSSDEIFSQLLKSSLNCWGELYWTSEGMFS